MYSLFTAFFTLTEHSFYLELFNFDTFIGYFYMALAIEQQISQIIGQHSNVLVCLPANPTTDAIASGLAMYNVLQKQGKQAKVVAAGFALPDNHRFLPKSDEIEHELSALRKFVVSVDITNTSVQDLAYDIKGNTLDIFITPKSGVLQSTNVRTSAQDYMFDLIIVLDSRDLPSLGKVFEDNADFFHSTPIINIDHHASNEQFGQVNVIDVTATSVSEIVFNLLEHIGENLLDEYLATSLLTGIISKTKSFKTNTVTPRSLAIASHLITNGARRDEIVKHLYQTKTLNTLQLWGRTLSKLESDPDYKIVWSTLSREDFELTGTNPLDVEDVIDELIVNTPDAENIYVVFEQPDEAGHIQVNAIIYTPPYIIGTDLFRDWRAQGSKNFTYVQIPHSSLSMAQTMIHERLRAQVKR